MRRQAPSLELPLGLPQAGRRTTERRLVRPAHAGRFERVRLLAGRAAFALTVALLAAVAGLAYLRASHEGRFYPAVVVADVPVGGMTREEAAAAVAARAASFGGSMASFSHEGQVWTAPLAEIGVTADVEAGLREAWQAGRENSALDRLRTAAGLLRGDRVVALPLAVDRARLDRWFDQIDADLGGTPSNASLAISGADVTVLPERDGYLVDRDVAAAELVGDLARMESVSEALPVSHVVPPVKAADLEGAKAGLALSLATPVQVRVGEGLWTLPPAELSRFVVQKIDPGLQGPQAFRLELDKPALTAWLDAALRPSIDRPVKDAKVGWNGERLVSVEESEDGLTLDSAGLAAAVEQSFLGARGVVDAPVLVDKPEVDSRNLAALGITTLLATGTSNYDGSGPERRTNVERGTYLLDGTLVPPRSEFSFNQAVGYIDEEAGFVEAQVIDGERIGKDVGGGICQVSTTVFRAAYYAGMPITEWWPHRFRIAFYEFDGWAPGLDASILQPSEDPSTWDDFRFYNPTDSWLLVEAFSNGATVTVNLYGPDTGYQVQDEGPYFGEKTEELADAEVVDWELDAGTIKEMQAAAQGQEVAHYRRVFDANGTVLWEEPFYTKFYPRGTIWKVSPDMKGKSPADPDREIEPLTEEERGEKLDVWAIAWEVQSRDAAGTQDDGGGWIDPATGEWVQPEAQG
ncbi:MAG: VanW family protein [Chloroflexota bacterium]